MKYHSPDSLSPDKLENKFIDIETANSAVLEGIKSNYIYDISVDMYDAVGGEGGTGNKIGSGSIYFLPQISFYAEVVKQQSVMNAAGGSETGVLPSLKLSWNVPKVYDPGSSSFILMNSSTAFSKVSADLKKFNYKINISDSVNRTDIDIEWDRAGYAGAYSACVSGNTERISKVAYDSVNERYYFYLLGVKEESELLPETIGEAVLPEGIPESERDNVLLDGDILPGTVYRMKINPFTTDNLGNYIGCLSMGPEGSSLLGNFPYTYTPIRFELTKDALDNVNVKIYKVNKGDLSLPQLYYEVQLNSIPSDQDNTWNQGPFKDKGKKLDGSYFAGDFAYAIISGVSPNNTVYYRVVVKSNSSNDRIDSMKLAYVIKDDIAKPPVPKNVIITNRQLVTDGDRNKSTDVTISWEKPSNWEDIINNTNPDEDIVYHFLLNIRPLKLLVLCMENSHQYTDLQVM